MTIEEKQERLAEISRHLYRISQGAHAMANSLTEQRLRAEYVEIENSMVEAPTEPEPEHVDGE